MAKNEKIILFALFFLFISSNIVLGFSGYSSNYDVSFQIQQFTLDDSNSNYNVSSEHVFSIAKANSSNYNHIFGVINYSSDRIPPSINITYPLNGTNVTSNTLSIALNVTFNETIQNATYQINSINHSLCANCNSTSINITLPSFGTNSVIVYATDLFNNENSKTTIFNLLLDSDNDGTPDNQETDADADGINDSEDNLIGTIDNVITNIANFNFTVNESANLSQQFNTTLPVKLKENNNTLIEFNYDFSSNRISLGEIKIQKYNTSNKGQLLITGLNLSSGITKTVYIDRINNNSNFSSLCIKDSEVFDISEISSSCDESDETLLNCPGTSGSYSCLAHTSGSLQQWKVTGLTHSAITQSCTESWSCGSWSSCISSTQTRTCTDSNNCGTFIYKPSTSQSCTSGTTSSGGSSSSGGVPYTAPTTTYVDINKPIEKEIKKGEILQFTIDEENHSITAKKINETEVTLEIKSTPFETIIKLNETKEFDLDNNGKNDLSIKVKELSSTIAKLIITNIETDDNQSQEESAINATEKNESNQETDLADEESNISKNKNNSDSEKIKNNYMIIFMVAFVLIVAIVLGLFFAFKKKPNKVNNFTPKEQELIAYIKKQKEKNVSDAIIKKELVNAGWPEEEIEKYIK